MADEDLFGGVPEPEPEEPEPEPEPEPEAEAEPEPEPEPEPEHEPEHEPEPKPVVKSQKKKPAAPAAAVPVEPAASILAPAESTPPAAPRQVNGFTLEVSVGEATKMGDGMSSFMVYKVSTKVRHAETCPSSFHAP